MLSNPPAVLVACDDPPLSIILVNLLTSAGVPTLLGTSSPPSLPSGCTNVTLSWEAPTTIPEIFDTGHTLRTVVLHLPQSLGHNVLAEIKSFIHLATAEGVVRFILLGTEGSTTEKVSAYLDDGGMLYTVLGVDGSDFDKTATIVLQTIIDSRFSGSDYTLPLGSERV